MAIERHPIEDRTEWLAWRRQDITASNIGALFGIHPFCTAFRLYVEKRGVELSEQQTAAMERGDIFEPAIAKAVSKKRPDWRLEKANVYLRDPERRLGATPDFFVTAPRGRGILQCKSVAPWVWEAEWDNGREPPQWVVLQATLEAMLDDAAFLAIGVLATDGITTQYEVFELDRDPAREQSIYHAAAEFWRMVADGREPPVDFEKDSAAITALTKRVVPGKTLDVTGLNEAPALAAQYFALMARQKADKKVCDAIKNQFKLMMGEAEKVIGLTDYSITFKNVTTSEYTVPERTTRQLRIYDKRPAHERPDADEAA